METNTVHTLDLIHSCAEGDLDSLKQFFEIYSEDIYNFPLRIFRLSEDDAGDFFIYAYERLKTGKRFKTFQGKSSFKTWFYSVLRNMLIDWKRTKRELKTSPMVKMNVEGYEFNTIENEPDRRSMEMENAFYITDEFYKAIANVKIENRVIFKLSYIYYLNLEDDEIAYILEKTDRTADELKSEVLRIREILSEKENENILSEDKITSLYLAIQRLKETKKKEERTVFNDNLPNINKIDLAIEKKYEQIQKLLEKKQKGRLLARTPHKMVAEILQISEGGVSVALLRVVEKLKKNFSVVE